VFKEEEKMFKTPNPMEPKISGCLEWTPSGPTETFGLKVNGNLHNGMPLACFSIIAR
jgi:hypothetical protein